MDLTTGLVIAIGIFALLVVGLLLFNRGKAKVRLSNKLGKFEASNEVGSKEYAIKIENAVSHTGGVIATDETGQGAHLNNIQVDKNIEVSVFDSSKKKSKDSR